jgi:hypothetical protein
MKITLEKIDIFNPKLAGSIFEADDIPTFCQSRLELLKTRHERDFNFVINPDRSFKTIPQEVFVSTIQSKLKIKIVFY